MKKSISKKQSNRFKAIDKFVLTNIRMPTNLEISLMFKISQGGATHDVIKGYMKYRKRCTVCGHKI